MLWRVLGRVPLGVKPFGMVERPFGQGRTPRSRPPGQPGPVSGRRATGRAVRAPDRGRVGRARQGAFLHDPGAPAVAQAASETLAFLDGESIKSDNPPL